MQELLLLVLYVSFHSVSTLEQRENDDSVFIEAVKSVIKRLTQILGSELLVNFYIGCAVAAVPLGPFLLFTARDAPPDDRENEISADEKHDTSCSTKGRKTLVTRKNLSEDNEVAWPLNYSDGLPSSERRFSRPTLLCHSISDSALIGSPCVKAIRLKESFKRTIRRSVSEIRIPGPPEESCQYRVKISPLEESCKSTVLHRSTNDSATAACAKICPFQKSCQPTLVPNSCVDVSTFPYRGAVVDVTLPSADKRHLSCGSQTDEQPSMAREVFTKDHKVSTALLSNLKCPVISENKLGIAVTCALLSFTAYRIIRRYW